MKDTSANRWLFLSGIFIALFCLTACQSSVTAQRALEDANIEKAIYCMDLMENKKDLERASEECFGDQYVQHHPRLPNGKDAVLSLFAKRFEQSPDFEITIKRAAASDDLVWLHAHVIANPGDLGGAIVHIFRLKDGKFIEHWSVSQPVPAEAANDNSMF